MRLKIDGMLLSTFLTSVFYSATYPYIHKEIMMVASDWLIAAEQIINCLGIVISGCVWNRWSDKLFRYYPVLCVVETVVSLIFAVWTICTRNLVAYYIINSLIFAVVTRNICCGGVKLRAIRYKTESEREHFDNNDNSVYAMATILGSIIAMKLNLDFEIMLGLAIFGNTIDNIFYICIYKSTVKKKQT